MDTHGTGKVEAQKLIKNIKEISDLNSRYKKMLNLANPLIKTATFGHFGRKAMKMVVLMGKNYAKVVN